MEIEKNKGGRPKKELNDEQLAQVEALAAFLTIEQIADYFGIHRDTFRAIYERDEEVFQRYKKGKARAVDSVAQTLLSQAREGNLTAAIFYLKTQGGWKETQGIEHSNPDGSLKPTVIKLVVPDDDNDSD